MNARVKPTPNPRKKEYATNAEAMAVLASIKVRFARVLKNLADR